MVNNLIRDIEQAMFNTLTNEQLSQLRTVLEYSFRNIEIVEKQPEIATDTNQNLIELFISAKKVEGCSEKSIAYYRSTLNKALQVIQKNVSHISTDDLRLYLNTYQVDKLDLLGTGLLDDVNGCLGAAACSQHRVQDQND